MTSFSQTLGLVRPPSYGPGEHSGAKQGERGEICILVMLMRLFKEVREEKVEDRVRARLVMVDEDRRVKPIYIASPSLHLTAGQDEGEVRPTITNVIIRIIFARIITTVICHHRV